MLLLLLPALCVPAQESNPPRAPVPRPPDEIGRVCPQSAQRVPVHQAPH